MRRVFRKLETGPLDGGGGHQLQWWWNGTHDYNDDYDGVTYFACNLAGPLSLPSMFVI